MMSEHAVKSELFYHKIPQRLHRRPGGAYKLYSLLKNPMEELISTGGGNGPTLSAISSYINPKGGFEKPRKRAERQKEGKKGSF